MRVLLVDDHRMMLEGLRAVLEQAQVNVVGEAASGREALVEAKRLRPDTVVMDVAMPGLGGIEATRQLVRELPGIRVVALSMSADRRYVAAMLEAGAIGYVLKEEAAGALLQALVAVRQGIPFLSPGVEAHGAALARRGTPPRLSAARALTPREREVLQLIAEGGTSKDIAVALGIGLPTVETHRRQIMTKLDLWSVADLTKYAVREGLTALDR